MPQESPNAGLAEGKRAMDAYGLALQAKEVIVLRDTFLLAATGTALAVLPALCYSEVARLAASAGVRHRLRSGKGQGERLISACTGTRHLAARDSARSCQWLAQSGHRDIGSVSMHQGETTVPLTATGSSSVTNVPVR